ncbi:MAG: murein hydrolase activator EnvC family protein [Syntrophobacteraceae bacterium]
MLRGNLNILALPKLFSCLFILTLLNFSPLLADIASVEKDETRSQPSSEPSQSDRDSHDSRNGKEEPSKEIELLEREYAQIQTNLEALQKGADGLYESARVRLVALYKFKQIGYAAPLFSATKLEEAIEGGYPAEKLLSMDSRILLDLYESGIKIGEAKTALLKKRRRIEAAKSAIEHEPNLALIEKRLPNRKPVFDFNWTPFPSKKGELPVPTEGEIIQAFSSKADASSRSILFNGGVIIKAPKGQGVQAVHEGIVMFADWLKDYGKVMIIDHGNHYCSLTAHADKLLKKVGDIVKVGDMIATVGNTGLQEGPRLYFEIRHYGKPLDPTEWLAARKSFKE